MTRNAWRIVAACGLGLGLACCGRRGGQPTAATPAVPPPTNEIAVVAVPTQPSPRAPEPPVLPMSLAEIAGSSELAVKAPRPGYVVRQLYTENQEVKEGQALFLIDPRSSHGDGGMGDKSEWVAVAAPVSGVVERARHGAGDWVNAQDELAAVAAIDEVKAELTLPDALGRQFADYLSEPTTADAHECRDIKLILPDESVYPEQGVLKSVVANGNVSTMEIDFPNHAHVLRPGEYVRVRSAP